MVYAYRKDILVHEGVSKKNGAKIGSGRYRLGTGKRPFQHGEWFNQNIKGGKDKPAKSRAEIMAEQSKKIVEGTRSSVEAVERLANRGKKGKDPTHMSDEQLRTRINRLNMERQYSQLTMPETSRGWEITKDILDVAGGVALLAIAGTTIASNVYTIKNMKNQANNK